MRPNKVNITPTKKSINFSCSYLYKHTDWYVIIFLSLTEMHKITFMLQMLILI
jgi:hypothetical protein